MNVPLPKLLKTKRFLPLFLTQFLGAFNDNVFKNALVMMITYKFMGQENIQILVTLPPPVFILPFFLFSATAGQLADKYDRALIARLTKVAEIVLMVIAAVGFYVDDIYFLLFVLFCTGVQATFFGPVKYALLPEHLHEDELISGNAYIEAGTFLAILLGIITGGILIMSTYGTYLVCAAMIVVALLGYASSCRIPPAPAPMPALTLNWNLFQATWQMIGNDRKTPRVFLSILGISWFWLVGATFISQFPSFAKDVLGGDETVVTLLLTVFSIGIGVGSMFCNWLVRGKVSSQYVPVAALGITLFTVDLFFSSHVMHGASVLISAGEFLGSFSSWRILFDLAMMAVCGGVYIVPLYAIMQHDSDSTWRARTIASNNVMNSLFMVMSAIATMLMLKASFSIPQVFLAVAVLNGLAAVYALRLNRTT